MLGWKGSLTAVGHHLVGDEVDIVQEYLVQIVAEADLPGEILKEVDNQLDGGSCGAEHVDLEETIQVDVMKDQGHKLLAQLHQAVEELDERPSQAMVCAG